MTLKISYISIHKKQGVLSFLLIFFTCASFAQTIKVRGEYKSVSLKYYSLDEACQLCYDYARREALASTFGEGLVGRTVITGDEQGSQMRDIQETFAKGTWVKTLKKDFETFDIEPEGKNQKKRTYLTCWIEGLAKKIPTDQRTIYATPRSISSSDSTAIPPTLENESGTKQYQFRHMSDFFLDVSTPEQGYLKIFYTDFTDVWQLFPYRSMPLNTKDQKTTTLLKPQKIYRLFDKTKPGFSIPNAWVEEVQLQAARAIDLDKVIVVLTKDYISPPNLLEVESEFPAMAYDQFIKWMESYRQKLEGDFASKDIFILLQK